MPFQDIDKFNITIDVFLSLVRAVPCIVDYAVIFFRQNLACFVVN